MIIIIIMLAVCVYALFGEALAGPFLRSDASIFDHAFTVDHLGNIFFMQCSCGAAPGRLAATPGTIMMDNKPVCTIFDNIPIVNITPFGACAILSGAPCVPATAAPWVPGSPTVIVGGKPALNINSKLMCSIGGVIQITVPGQFKVDVP